jgi:hypothetical protein
MGKGGLRYQFLGFSGGGLTSLTRDVVLCALTVMITVYSTHIRLSGIRL